MMFPCERCGKQVHEDEGYNGMCEDCYEKQIEEWEKEQEQLEREYRNSVL